MIFKSRVGVIWNPCDKFSAPNLEDLQGNFSPEYQGKPRGITTSGTTAEHLKVMSGQVIYWRPAGKTTSSRRGDWWSRGEQPVKSLPVNHSGPWAKIKCLRVRKKKTGSSPSSAAYFLCDLMWKASLNVAFFLYKEITSAVKSQMSSGTPLHLPSERYCSQDGTINMWRNLGEATQKAGNVAECAVSEHMPLAGGFQVHCFKALL